MDIEELLNGMMVSLGSGSDDRNVPQLQASGEVLLEAGESVRYRGVHRISTNRTDKSTGRVVPMRGFEVEADVTVTEGRLIYTWPRWKSDRSSGSFIERRVLTGLLERSEGKAIPAGHLRAAWIAGIQVRKPSGLRRKTRDVRVQVGTRTANYGVEICNLDPADALNLGELLAKIVAAERIERNGKLSAEHRTRLEVIADGRITADTSGGSWLVSTPGGMVYGFDYGE